MKKKFCREITHLSKTLHSNLNEHFLPLTHFDVNILFCVLQTYYYISNR